jgi:hypothetical protein
MAVAMGMHTLDIIQTVDMAHRLAMGTGREASKLIYSQ